jgi:hypothetical protein
MSDPHDLFSERRLLTARATSRLLRSFSLSLALALALMLASTAATRRSISVLSGVVMASLFARQASARDGHFSSFCPRFS